MGGLADCGAVRGDEGCMALRSRPAEGGFKPPATALAEDRCGERRREKSGLDPGRCEPER